MSAAGYPRLVGDVGGTNARFALVEAPGAAPAAVVRYPMAELPSLQAAVERYLGEVGEAAAGRRPSQAAIGIANPVTGDRVQMTNHPWSFSIEQTRRALGLERLLVLNDFQALALALPALGDADRVQIGGGAPAAGEPLALIGPGTGLGVSGLVWAGGVPVALDGEGGHVTLAGATHREERVIARLRRRFGHVSAERALSGQGLENLHQALDGAPGLGAADITARALDGSDAACAAAVDVFCALLGSTAGNLALTLGARGGVYVGGGIVPRLVDRLAASAFRERFEHKGRMTPYLQAIPTWVITARTSPALLGAARALDRP